MHPAASAATRRAWRAAPPDPSVSSLGRCADGTRLVPTTAGAAAATARAASEARLRRIADRSEDRQLAADVFGAAVRAVRLIAVSHELLEVRLARHAHVLVDRHRLVSVSPPDTIALPGIRYGTGAKRCSTTSPSSAPAAEPARRSPHACASAASSSARPEPTSSSSASRTRAIADVAALDRAGPVGRARQRHDAARRARPARAALQRPSAPDARQEPRPRAAGRCIRRRHGETDEARDARHVARETLGLQPFDARRRARGRSTTRAPSSRRTTS